MDLGSGLILDHYLDLERMDTQEHLGVSWPPAGLVGTNAREQNSTHGYDAADRPMT